MCISYISVDFDLIHFLENWMISGFPAVHAYDSLNIEYAKTIFINQNKHTLFLVGLR